MACFYSVNRNRQFTTLDGEAAQVLGEFFTSVFVKEDGDQNSSHKEVNVNGLDVNINKDIVLDKLLQLKEDKAQGPDEIHPAVLNKKPSYCCESQPSVAIFRT